jgi:hypothetical protein
MKNIPMIKDKYDPFLEKKYIDFLNLMRNIFARYPHINSISWHQFLNINDYLSKMSYTIGDMKINNQFIDLDRDLEYRQIFKNIIEKYVSSMEHFFGTEYSVELKRNGEIEISDYEYQF